MPTAVRCLAALITDGADAGRADGAPGLANPSGRSVALGGRAAPLGDRRRL